MQLADIPLVLHLAQWIWGASKAADVDPTICLSLVPFLSGGCISQLVAKALGVAIILGSCLNKTPIMVNLYNSKSASGLSRNSLYGEMLMYANGAVYGFLEGHPLTAYGENVALMLQNIVIIGLVWKFGKVTFAEQGSAVVSLLLYCAAVLTILPEDQRYLLMASLWPIMIYARGTQIWETFQEGHTGSLSIVTTGLNLAGSLARIGTTLTETGDATVLLGFALSVGLNFVMFVQYWLYLENTKKLAQDKKEKAE